MNPSPEWLVVGAPVAVIQDDPRSGLSIQITSVVRIGKRDVVLASSDRFPVATLRKRLGDWYSPLALVAAADPRVTALRRVIALERRRTEAMILYENWRRHKTSARAVAEAFTALADDEAAPP